MPDSMTHLIVARKINPEGSTVFFLGNLTPDAVVEWPDKDIVHLRDLDDREPTLIALAKETTGDFAEGILLHLYVDWVWDETIRQEHRNKIADDWFTIYRNELSLAGCFSFHNNEWAKQLWHDMDALDVCEYGITPRATTDDVKEYISRNNKWHNETNIGPSPAFPPEIIEEFALKIAKEYPKWRFSAVLA
jgi:hypothetical protein